MSTDSSPRRGNFFVRVLRATVVVLFWLAVLAGLVGAFWLGTREIQRSFDSVTARIDANKDRIAMLQGSSAPSQQMDAVSAQTAVLQTQLTQLQADVDAQNALLTQLTTDLATAVATNETAIQNSAAIGDGLLALQQDMSQNGQYLDTLGGDIDSTRIEVDALTTTLTETAVSLHHLQDTLQLFQLNQLISRARLQLLQNDPAATTADIEQAQVIIEAWLPTAPPDVADVLQNVQRQLTAVLPGLQTVEDPTPLALNLETAVGDLDQLLKERLESRD